MSLTSQCRIASAGSFLNTVRQIHLLELGVPVDARRPRRLVLRPPARALDEVVAPEEGLVVRVVVEGADLLFRGCEGDGLDVVCFNR